MCGLAEEDETDTDGNITKVRFYPDSALVTAGNLTVYVDDLKRVISGVRANLKISFEVGSIAKITFDIKGYADAESVNINKIYAIGAKEYQITDYKLTLTVRNYAKKRICHTGLILKMGI